MAWELDDEVAFRADVIRASLEMVRELEAMPLVGALAQIAAQRDRRHVPAGLPGLVMRRAYRGPERRVR